MYVPLVLVERVVVSHGCSPEPDMTYVTGNMKVAALRYHRDRSLA